MTNLVRIFIRLSDRAFREDEDPALSQDIIENIINDTEGKREVEGKKNEGHKT